MLPAAAPRGRRRAARALAGLAVLGVLMPGCGDPCEAALGYQESYDRADRVVQQARRDRDASDTPESRRLLSAAQAQADSIADQASSSYLECGRPLPGYSIPVRD